jgi:hypothetical protein
MYAPMDDYKDKDLLKLEYSVKKLKKEILKPLVSLVEWLNDKLNRVRFIFNNEISTKFLPLTMIFELNLMNTVLIGLSYVYFETGLYIRLWLLGFRFEWQFDLKKRGEK